MLERILFSSKNKLFFNNGYYDFNKRKFINNFDNVETLIKLNRDFKESSLDDQNKVREIIFEPIFNEDTNEALLFSRAVAGHVEDKLWSIMLGSRDARKGIICDSISAAFDKYFAVFNADILCLIKMLAMHIKNYHGRIILIKKELLSQMK